jgi:hypothetical protein
VTVSTAGVDCGTGTGVGERMGRGTRERPSRARLSDVAGWTVLGVLTAVAVYLGSFWFADSWLQPTMLGAVAVALSAGLRVGDRRAARSGSPRRAEAVRYGLLFAMLFASAVGVLLLAWTVLLTTMLGGWAS